MSPETGRKLWVPPVPKKLTRKRQKVKALVVILVLGVLFQILLYLGPKISDGLFWEPWMEVQDVTWEPDHGRWRIQVLTEPKVAERLHPEDTRLKAVVRLGVSYHSGWQEVRIPLFIPDGGGYPEWAPADFIHGAPEGERVRCEFLLRWMPRRKSWMRDLTVDYVMIRLVDRHGSPVRDVQRFFTNRQENP